MNTDEPIPGRVEVRRVLPASPAIVFDCFTSGERLGLWFYAGDATSCRATTEFRVGGRYELRMSGPGDQESVHAGRYLEIDRPRRLRFTWNHGPELDSLVTFDLEPAGDQTLLTVTHVELPPDMSRLFRDGWAQCLGYLARLFTGA